MRQFLPKEKLIELQQKVNDIIEEWGITDLKGVSGLYFIKYYDKILYIGKADDLAYRMARHKMHILDPNDEPEKKYDLLRELIKIKGQDPLSFFYCQFPQNECSRLEAHYINEYKPILNTQYPIYDMFSSYMPIKWENRELPNFDTLLWFVESGERNDLK